MPAFPAEGRLQTGGLMFFQIEQCFETISALTTLRVHRQRSPALTLMGRPCSAQVLSLKFHAAFPATDSPRLISRPAFAHFLVRHDGPCGCKKKAALSTPF